MPSIAAHMICAKLVSDSLNITEPAFIKGNLLPDISLEEDSHKRIQGKYYYIPNIDYFLNAIDLKNTLQLGYLCHLLLDKYFLEDYIYTKSSGQNIFASRIIYKEYDYINYKLLQNFNINIEYLNKVLKKYEVPIDNEKYNKNINCLNIGPSDEELKYLNVDDFSNFLINTSNKIIKELKEVIKNEC